MTLTEAGAQVQAAGQLRVTGAEGWRAGRAQEEGFRTGVCGEGAARAEEG